MNENIPSPTQKCMIIIWRWATLDEVDDSYLLNIPNWKTDIEGLRGKAFEAIPIKNSKKTQSSTLIRANLIEGEETRQLLYTLIERYYSSPMKAFLFLHRKNGYVKEVFLEILAEKEEIDKAFIFSDGEGAIYMNDPDMGLLGGRDFFEGQIPLKSGGMVSVSVVEKKKGNTVSILQPYFDRVWDHYAFQFKSLLYDFQYDLHQHFLPYMNPYGQIKIPLREVKQNLEKNELLHLRIRSFLQEPIEYGDEDESFEEVYIIKLLQYERKHRKAYHFPDLLQNLRPQLPENQSQVDKAYQFIHKELEKILYEADEETIAQENLLQLRNQFAQLLNMI